MTYTFLRAKRYIRQRLFKNSARGNGADFGNRGLSLMSQYLSMHPSISVYNISDKSLFQNRL